MYACMHACMRAQVLKYARLRVCYTYVTRMYQPPPYPQNPKQVAQPHLAFMPSTRDVRSVQHIDHSVPAAKSQVMAVDDGPGGGNTIRFGDLYKGSMDTGDDE